MELQWPLILFTTFIAWSAGLFGTQAVYALRGDGAKAQMPALVTSFVLMVIGGVAVFFHLQHWERIFNGFGHITSGITQELIGIVLVFIMMVVFFVYLRRGEGGKVPAWAAVLAIVFSAVLVCVMGHSYMMPSRPTWDSALQVLSLIGAALAMGAGTFALLDSAKSDAPSAKTGAIALAGTLSDLATTVLYVVGMAAANGSFRDYGFHFDATHPNKGLVQAAQYSPFAGDALVPVIVAIVFAALTVVFALLGKKDGKWKVWGCAIAVAAVISALCLRVAFYDTGASVVMF